MSKQTLNLIKENEARWVDLRFTDTHGKEQHVTIPSKEVTKAFSKAAKCLTAHPSLAGKASTIPTWC